MQSVHLFLCVNINFINKFFNFFLIDSELFFNITFLCCARARYKNKILVTSENCTHGNILIPFRNCRNSRTLTPLISYEFFFKFFNPNLYLKYGS
jgi:hypothetical protein